MSSLLPANTTQFEKDLEATVATADDLPVTIRNLWVADNCPEELLPWLAWATSVDVWDSDWPAHIKRSVINAAFESHRIKGTRTSIDNVVAGFGADISIIEWFENPTNPTPHNFTAIINYNGETVEQEFQDGIISAIERTKPVRSQYTVETGIRLDKSLNIGGAIRVTHYQRLEFYEQ